VDGLPAARKRGGHRARLWGHLARGKTRAPGPTYREMASLIAAPSGRLVCVAITLIAEGWYSMNRHRWTTTSFAASLIVGVNNHSTLCPTLLNTCAHAPPPIRVPSFPPTASSLSSRWTHGSGALPASSEPEASCCRAGAHHTRREQSAASRHVVWCGGPGGCRISCAFPRACDVI
jgi:hypothetical protein